MCRRRTHSAAAHAPPLSSTAPPAERPPPEPHPRCRSARHSSFGCKGATHFSHGTRVAVAQRLHALTRSKSSTSWTFYSLRLFPAPVHAAQYLSSHLPPSENSSEVKAHPQRPAMHVPPCVGTYTAALFAAPVPHLPPGGGDVPATRGGGWHAWQHMYCREVHEYDDNPAQHEHTGQFPVTPTAQAARCTCVDGRRQPPQLHVRRQCTMHRAARCGCATGTRRRALSVLLPTIRASAHNPWSLATPCMFLVGLLCTMCSCGRHAAYRAGCCVCRPQCGVALTDPGIPASTGFVAASANGT
jgi:hypothetical protein